MLGFSVSKGVFQDDSFLIVIYLWAVVELPVLPKRELQNIDAVILIIYNLDRR